MDLSSLSLPPCQQGLPAFEMSRERSFVSKSTPAPAVMKPAFSKDALIESALP